MSIDSLAEIVPILLAISLASERFVTAVKTLLPEFLEDEKKTPAREVDLIADRWRRFSVQLLAFVASWFVAGFLANGNDFLKGMVESVVFAKSAGNNGIPIPSFVIGLLASGGSSFWNNILGYTKATKDIQIQERARQGLDYREQAKAAGVVVVNDGRVALVPTREELQKKLDTIQPPVLN